MSLLSSMSFELSLDGSRIGALLPCEEGFRVGVLDASDTHFPFSDLEYRFDMLMKVALSNELG